MPEDPAAKITPFSEPTSFCSQPFVLKSRFRCSSVAPGGRSQASDQDKWTSVIGSGPPCRGQATVGQFQPQVFSPGATADAVNLIAALIEDLPRLTSHLGWNQESSNS